MTQITILLDNAVAGFYEQVAKRAQLPVEKVLSDALFQLAAELSVQALEKTC